MIVIDASAAVELLTEQGEVGAWVAESLASEGSLGAPHLIDSEFLSALRKLLVRLEISLGAATDAIAGFDELRITRYPVTGLLDRIWQLRSRLTPYDASYVALAEILGLPLLTTDARLARAGGHRAEVVTYGV